MKIVEQIEPHLKAGNRWRQMKVLAGKFKNHCAVKKKVQLDGAAKVIFKEGASQMSCILSFLISFLHTHKAMPGQGKRPHSYSPLSHLYWRSFSFWLLGRLGDECHISHKKEEEIGEEVFHSIDHRYTKWKYGENASLILFICGFGHTKQDGNLQLDTVEGGESFFLLQLCKKWEQYLVYKLTKGRNKSYAESSSPPKDVMENNHNNKRKGFLWRWSCKRTEKSSANRAVSSSLFTSLISKPWGQRGP